jgi:hypothetical protein
MASAGSANGLRGHKIPKNFGGPNDLLTETDVEEQVLLSTKVPIKNYQQGQIDLHSYPHQRLDSPKSNIIKLTHNKP